ncbi:MAG: hypothetical protein A2511_08540 [Deltaproteobacteria bacterium RIFOXYD12_FULL_50_9]|nr:MAG: hypothetical protein A2511_08540 [Deltaproteobacteria bacterium RIFOXYD12_FULL_50_9]
MPTITIDLPGVYEIGLMVNDGYDISAIDTVLLTVAVNILPVANAGQDQAAHAGSILRLDGSASSDADGDNLFYNWTLVTAPPGSAADLSDPYTVNPTLIIDSLGEYMIQLVVDDGLAISEPDTVILTSNNVKPVADAGPDQLIYSIAPVSLNGSASHDADNDALIFLWSIISKPEGSNATLSDPSIPVPSLAIDLYGRYIVQLIVNDGYENSDPDTVVLAFDNIRPVADAGADQTNLAGETVILDGSGSHDANNDALSFSWSIITLPDNSQAIISDPQALAPTFTPDLEGTYIAQLMVSDGFMTSQPDTVVITVTHSLVIGAINAPVIPVPVYTEICAQVEFSGAGASPVTEWNWDDGTFSAGIIAHNEETKVAEGCHVYSEAGVYVLRFTLTGLASETRQADYRYLVVYDPNSGYVTGGGWINSPVGAYTQNPSLTGKANFGFVSKYKNGATLPTGNTEFNFKMAGLNFHSESYLWLVVAGAKAKYKGTGTINGSGNFGFMLSAIDGQQSDGGGIDKFRIKIWEAVSGTLIYDNQMGASDDADASLTIAGGSIVVHKE